MSNTNELTVDVRGSLCPKPVIETKKVAMQIQTRLLRPL